MWDEASGTWSRGPDWPDDIYRPRRRRQSPRREGKSDGSPRPAPGVPARYPARRTRGTAARVDAALAEEVLASILDILPRASRRTCARSSPSGATAPAGSSPISSCSTASATGSGSPARLGSRLRLADRRPGRLAWVLLERVSGGLGPPPEGLGRRHRCLAQPGHAVRRDGQTPDVDGPGHPDP